MVEFIKFETLLTIFIILVLFFIIYSRLKNNTLRETWEEIVDLFTGGKD
jgi:hypothetical protein